MKTYTHLPGGSYQIGNMSIPPDPNNTDYARLLAELAANPPQAEVVEAPAPPVDGTVNYRATLLADIDQALKDEDVATAVAKLKEFVVT